MGCGRKGPPLPPIVLLPSPVAEFTAKRAGDSVVVRFVIPVANIDASTPADLEHVEVYAHTGPLPAPTDYFKYGTLIADLKVKQPVVAGEVAAAAAAVSAAREKPAADLVEQGWAVTVSEPFSAALLEPGQLPFVPTTPITPIADVGETPGTVNFPLPIRRYYTAVPVSRSRNRRTNPAVPQPVALVDPPAPPEGLTATYTETAITLVWNPMPGDRPIEPPVVPPDLETPGTVDAPEKIETEGTVNLSDEVPAPSAITPPAPGAPAPVPLVPAVAAPGLPLFGYNIYPSEATPVETPAIAGTVTVGRPVAALNAAMLTTPTFTDALTEFGAPRCYALRRVEIVSGAVIESPSTSPVCVTPVDTFPPAAPKGLAAVSDDKGVNLIWEANTETALGGYLVVRQAPGAAAFVQLTPEPIKETAFRDTTAEAGRTYLYAVQAVDTAVIPNKSEDSNHVEVVR